MLRQQMRLNRDSLSPSQQQMAAQLLSQHVMATSYYQNSEHIAVYWAIGGEVSVQPLINAAWGQGKRCYLPVVTQQQMVFVEYRQDAEMVTNVFGIPEPADQSRIISATELDLVITPLVAFDKHANRLGMGGGYYDRTFSFLMSDGIQKPHLMGVAHACQEVDSLRAQAWDVPLHSVVTDKGIVVGTC